MIISNITGKSYTPQDFLPLLEKRLRKHIRLHDLISQGGVYKIDTSTLAGAVLRHFLLQIFEERITFSEEGTPLSVETLDDYISKNLSSFFTAKALPAIIISPLQCISRGELLQAAKLLDLSGSLPPEPHSFIEELHKIYPQTRSSFLKSFLHIDSLRENISEKQS